MKELMTPVDEDIASAGITDVHLSFKEFNFMKALDFIKGKLSEEFLREQWSDTLVDVACTFRNQSKVSVCWYAIRFLDVLWDMLFGRTNGPSPWKHFLGELEPLKSNGSADQIISYFYVRDALICIPTKAEEIICENLSKYFPMKLLMPPTAVLSSYTEPPKREGEAPN
ncbi:hypothetical protein F5Y06DRAFT_277973 [Hypoxylon sp. FL0890]|nr:hypothetical protein F5Y06DRAFT_277973 [Hypoxylon sp. FL0890]